MTTPRAVARLAKVDAVVEFREAPVAAGEDVVYLEAHVLFLLSFLFSCCVGVEGCFVRWDV